MKNPPPPISLVDRDLPIVAQLWLLDRLAGPYPETAADRIRERRKGCTGHSLMRAVGIPRL